MLRKNLLLIASLLFAEGLAAQDPIRGPAAGSGANIHDHLIIQQVKRALGEGPEERVEGSPYLSEEFLKGTVITSKHVFAGIDMRYNIHEGVIEFRQKDQTYWLDPMPQIVRVDMGEYRFIVGAEDGGQDFEFYEVLDSGTVLLVAQRRISFQAARPPQALQSSATPAKYTRMPDVYLYQIPGGLLTRVTNLKRLLADLPGDRKALADFADRQNISVRKKEDLVQLIHYCNASIQ